MSKPPPTSRRMPLIRIWGAYLVCQGIAGAVWWGCLIGVPSTRDYFKPPAAPDWAILAFWFADVTVFVTGSLLSALFVFKESPWAKPILWFTTGGVSYAALYCLGLSLLTGTVWLASAAMLPAMAITLWISLRYEMLHRP